MENSDAITPEKRSRKIHSDIRKMGISLLALGILIVALGLLGLWHGSEESSLLRSLSLSLFGTVLLAAGLYTWRNAKDERREN